MKARMRTAIVLAVTGLLTACGDDSAVVTAPTDTTVAATTTTADTTTTTASADSPFVGGCEEYQRETPAVSLVDSEQATFGPLATEPGLTITLPFVNASFKYVLPTATRVPGGVLVVASTNRFGYPAGGTLAPPGAVIAVVDDDGGVRWVRCLDRTATVSRWSATATDAVVTLDVDDGGEVRLISLADGTIGDDIVAAPVWPPLGHLEWDYSNYSSAYVAPLQYVGADGAVEWTDTSFVEPGGEGSHVAVAGDVAVVRGCRAGEFVVGAGCRTPGLRGYRISDGRVLWERVGEFDVSLGGDGFALVASPDNWLMIDARTGEDVSGQAWDRINGFNQGCCGDAETWAARFGGVVIASSDQTIRVYYPIDANLEPHKVDLP